MILTGIPHRLPILAAFLCLSMARTTCLFTWPSWNFWLSFYSLRWNNLECVGDKLLIVIIFLISLSSSASSHSIFITSLKRPKSAFLMSRVLTLFFHSPCPWDPEFHHLMVTAGWPEHKAVFDLHIPNMPLLGEQCTSPNWLLSLGGLEKEVTINALQEPPGLLRCCYQCVYAGNTI